MAKYKLLNQEGYATFNFAAGDVYDETDESSAGLTVLYLAKNYPDDWQLIEENQEKRPIMTYIILSIMMVLYLYAGLAAINWPLYPATFLGLYLLIKNERNGRK